MTPEDRSSAATGVVVDASVVAKWFLEEELAGQARSILDSSLVLAAPDLLVPELGSVFREKVRSREMTPATSVAAIEVAIERVILVPSEDVFEEALNIALATNLSSYDALYVALARKLAVDLVTDDTRMRRTLGDEFLHFVRALAEYGV